MDSITVGVKPYMKNQSKSNLVTDSSSGLNGADDYMILLDTNIKIIVDDEDENCVFFSLI